jgi:transposase-like protein
MSKRPKAVHQMTIAEFEAMFPDEDACCAYLVARRWPEGVRCPRCGAENPHKLSNRSWQCYQCAPETSYRFSHIAGTIFENTNKPLRDWFRIVHMMMTGKKGISALQVKRVMGFGSYESAWSMCHKIRTALIENPVEQLGRIVEMDETYASGEDKNRHWDKRSHRRGRGAGGKTPVIGAVKPRATWSPASSIVSAGKSSSNSSERPFRTASACFAPTPSRLMAISKTTTRTALSITMPGSTLSAQSTPTRSRAFGRF